MTNSLPNGLRISIAAALISICAPSAAAQSSTSGSTSREVVQPLPSPAVQRLNRALLELARAPRSVSALLEAGDASLAVDDLDAAVGFYSRAAELDPSDARAKLGSARVYLRSGRPVEALPLLEQAQSNGAQLRDVISPRALAYDLVGDQEAAQRAYATALELAPQDDEARRRFALSQAISGNATGFQETLAPLIEARDVAAFRARAFGLAIMGEQERAEGIVNSVMPRDLAARINPYLAYMPRLTPAQQAAAANLGIFPRAADIGREDPRIARFARENESGSRLEPAGAPLGTPVEVADEEARGDVREAAVVEQAQGYATAQAATDETYGPLDAQSAPATANLVEVSRGSDTAQAADIPDIGVNNEEEGQGEAEASLPVVTTREIALSPAQETASFTSVADAFADLDEGELPKAAPTQDAVDIASLDVPREVQEEAEPAKPEHPRRIWVQLATGRDVSALRFDWRRFSRRAPELLSDFRPHVTPWGRANRLLAGPLESNAQARRLVNALSAKGIETFTYISPQGTEIKEIN